MEASADCLGLGEMALGAAVVLPGGLELRGLHRGAATAAATSTQHSSASGHNQRDTKGGYTNSAAGLTLKRAPSWNRIRLLRLSDNASGPTQPLQEYQAAEIDTEAETMTKTGTETDRGAGTGTGIDTEADTHLSSEHDATGYGEYCIYYYHGLYVYTYVYLYVPPSLTPMHLHSLPPPSHTHTHTHHRYNFFVALLSVYLPYLQQQNDLSDDSLGFMLSVQVRLSLFLSLSLCVCVSVCLCVALSHTHPFTPLPPTRSPTATLTHTCRWRLCCSVCTLATTSSARMDLREYCSAPLYSHVCPSPSYWRRYTHWEAGGMLV